MAKTITISEKYVRKHDKQSAGRSTLVQQTTTTDLTSEQIDKLNTAYDERHQWDGGATNLAEATGRASLGLGNLAVLNTVDTAQIDAKAVTYAKIQDVTTSRVLGRITAGSGVVEELTGANVRSIAGTLETGTAGGQIRTNTQLDARYLLEANNLSDLANIATARNNLVVAQKQSSVTDTTAGRGLIVGAFGLGTYGITSTNINTTGGVNDVNQFIKVAAGATGIPSGAARGGVIQVGYTESERSQMYFDPQNSKTYIRHRYSTTADTWKAEQELYHTGNRRSNADDDARFVEVAGDTMTGALGFGAGSYISNEARAYTDADLGLVITSTTGTTNDFTLASAIGQTVLAVPAGTRDLTTGLGNVGFGTTTPTEGYKLDVNGKGIFQDDLVVDGLLKHKSFNSGWQGTNYKVWDVGDAEFRNVKITGGLEVSELILNQIRYQDGGLIIGSGGGKVATVHSATVGSEQLYFEDPEGNGFVPFTAGHIVMMQVFDINSTTIIKRIVRQVSAVQTDGRIDLTTTTGWLTTADTGTIGKSDVIVGIGHTTNTNYQDLIYMSAVDSGSPFTRYFSGIDSYDKFNLANQTALKVAVGNLDSIDNATGFGIYGERQYFTEYLLAGDLTKASNYMEYSAGVLAVTGTIHVTNPIDVRTDLNVSDGADVTGDNTAADITGQGSLATQNDADFDTQVSGAEKPSNNADVTSTIITGGLVTTGTLQVVQGGTVAAGITGNTSGDTAVRFWAGSSFADRALSTTPFRVTQAGKLYASNAEIEGKITAKEGEVGGLSIDSDGIYSTGDKHTTGGFSTDGITILNDGAIHTPNLYINSDGNMGIRAKEMIYAYLGTSENVLINTNEEVLKYQTTFQKMLSIELAETIVDGGRINVEVRFDMKSSDGSAVYGQIYVNGAEYSDDSMRTSTTYSTISNLVNIMPGYSIEVWGYTSDSALDTYVIIKDLRIMGDCAKPVNEINGTTSVH